ncbi:MAG: hypothetical protein KIG53_06160 [Oscillospiraceae bacterium]|nr:hypothetical protein [Oscillospiraceae bacterium]
MAINGVEMITDRSASDVLLAKNLIKKGFQNMTEDEKNSFLSGLKGAYNYIDVNRVETAIKYFVDTMLQIYEQNIQLAKELGVDWAEIYDVPYNPEDYKNIVIKNDWQINDLFTKTDRIDFLNKIALVLSALPADTNYLTDANGLVLQDGEGNYLKFDGPQTGFDDFPTSLDGLDYKKANVIEKSLEDFNVALTDLKINKESLIIGTAKAWYYSGDLYGGEI